MSTPRINKLTWWIALLGVVGVIWAVLPLLQGNDSAPLTPTTTPAVDNTWIPAPAAASAPETTLASDMTVETGTTITAASTSATPTVPEDHSAEGDPVVHSEEEPADQPTLAAVPSDTPIETLEALAEAVETRLTAELTGEGRDTFEDAVWRTEPCCAWVAVTGVVADFSNPELVRVIVEWETDVGEGSGPTYWTPDSSGSWVPAVVESTS